MFVRRMIPMKSQIEMQKEARCFVAGFLEKYKLSIGLNNNKSDFLPQLAQNVVMGVLPFGDRIRGTAHPGVGQD